MAVFGERPHPVPVPSDADFASHCGGPSQSDTDEALCEGQSGPAGGWIASRVKVAP